MVQLSLHHKAFLLVQVTAHSLQPHTQESRNPRGLDSFKGRSVRALRWQRNGARVLEVLRGAGERMFARGELGIFLAAVFFFSSLPVLRVCVSDDVYCDLRKNSC